MRKLGLLFPVLLLLLGFTAGQSADQTLSNLLLQFETNEEKAKSDIFYAVTDSSYVIPNAKLLRDISARERVKVIGLMGKNLKEYLASNEFLERYNQFREDNKPAVPEAPKYSAQLKDELREALKKSIAEIERNKAQVAEDQQAMFDEIIKGLRQQLLELDDPKNTIFSPEMDAHIKTSYEMQMAEYAKNVAAWEEAYPQNNPRPTIERWINGFLEESAGIDFAADTTKTKDGIRKFVDPEYERKNKRWKLYFRTGEETVAAARAFARDWLVELK